jgi:hypothetical protein
MVTSDPSENVIDVNRVIEMGNGIGSVTIAQTDVCAIAPENPEAIT